MNNSARFWRAARTLSVIVFVWWAMRALGEW